MSLRTLRPRRNQAAMLASGVLMLGAAAAPVAAQASGAAAASVKPNLTNLRYTPHPAHYKKGFRVKFHTNTGGSYVIFIASQSSGGPIDMGTAKKGNFVSKVLGKDLHPIKGLTLGVDLTVGKVTKRFTTKMDIVK